MKVKLTKRLDLSDLGKEWKDCYLEFRSPSYAEIRPIIGIDPETNQQEATEKVFSIIKKLFVKGKVLTDDGIEEIKADDLENLPVELINKSVELLVGNSPKL